MMRRTYMNRNIEQEEYELVKPDVRIHKFNNVPSGSVYVRCGQNNRQSSVVVISGSSGGQSLTLLDYVSDISLQLRQIKEILNVVYEVDISSEDVDKL